LLADIAASRGEQEEQDQEVEGFLNPQPFPPGGSGFGSPGGDPYSWKWQDTQRGGFNFGGTQLVNVGTLAGR
jgi:hypothetical protein